VKSVQGANAMIVEKSKPLDEFEINFLAENDENPTTNESNTDTAANANANANNSIASELNYLRISKHVFPKQCTPQLKTKYGVDTSLNLKQLIGRSGGFNGLLGQFQFSYLSFIYGHNYERYYCVCIVIFAGFSYLLVVSTFGKRILKLFAVVTNVWKVFNMRNFMAIFYQLSDLN
jgi:hypothetical protein